MKRISLLITVVLLAGLSSFAQAAHIAVFQATITGDQASAGLGSGSTALGSATATFNSNTNEFEWLVAWQGLSSPITAAHFHGPAGPNANAGVEVAIDLNFNPSAGSAILSAQQKDDLFADLWYVNIHTEGFPGGEIRGQLLNISSAVNPVPLPAAVWMMTTGVGGLLIAKRKKT